MTVRVDLGPMVAHYASAFHYSMFAVVGCLVAIVAFLALFMMAVVWKHRKNNGEVQIIGIHEIEGSEVAASVTSPENQVQPPCKRADSFASTTL